jgi:hypothetical protein
MHGTKINLIPVRPLSHAALPDAFKVSMRRAPAQALICINLFPEINAIVPAPPTEDAAISICHGCPARARVDRIDPDQRSASKGARYWTSSMARFSAPPIQDDRSRS